jgi:ubiquinone/menaquinone biosynthesis C-methylase UbiE
MFEEIQRSPEIYRVDPDDKNFLGQPPHQALVASLGNVENKKILELGCGTGWYSVFLAKRGARVTGVDLGPMLVATANCRARTNQVACEFLVANIRTLPFEAETYDAITGISILHHLDQGSLRLAFQEIHRILKKGGVASFCEPVENSKVFDFIQDLFPHRYDIGGRVRPSRFQRKKWQDWAAHPDDRALSRQELESLGRDFDTVDLRPFGFLVRLTQLIGKEHRPVLNKLDTALFRSLPPLRYLCQMIVSIYQKN